jgi:hypothetical protein
MKTELVRVCGVLYQVKFSEGPMGEPEIVTVHVLGEDHRKVTSERFAQNWYNMLSDDHYNAVFMAVQDGNFIFERTVYDDERHFIPTYHPELFLAIAAMTTGDDPIVGEWMVSVTDHFDGYFGQIKKGQFKFCEADGDMQSLTLWRKPTLTELIEHFTPAQADKPKSNDMGKNELRKTVETLAEGINTLKSLIKEPEPEFKVGDWVVITSKMCHDYDDTARQIIEKAHAFDWRVSINGGGNYSAVDSKHLRHATPSEIAEAKAKITDKELEQKEG